VVSDLEAEHEVVRARELVARAVAIQHLHPVLEAEALHLGGADPRLLAGDGVAGEPEVRVLLGERDEIRGVSAAEIENALAGREVDLAEERLTHLLLRLEAEHGLLRVPLGVGEGADPREAGDDGVERPEGQVPLGLVLLGASVEHPGRAGNGVVVLGDDAPGRAATPLVLVGERLEQAGEEPGFALGEPAGLAHLLRDSVSPPRREESLEPAAVRVPAALGSLDEIALPFMG